MSCLSLSPGHSRLVRLCLLVSCVPCLFVAPREKALYFHAVSARGREARCKRSRLPGKVKRPTRQPYRQPSISHAWMLSHPLSSPPPDPTPATCPARSVPSEPHACVVLILLLKPDTQQAAGILPHLQEGSAQGLLGNVAAFSAFVVRQEEP